MHSRIQRAVALQVAVQAYLAIGRSQTMILDIQVVQELRARGSRVELLVENFQMMEEILPILIKAHAPINLGIKFEIPRAEVAQAGQESQVEVAHLQTEVQ
jgi:hypothetical protein